MTALFTQRRRLDVLDRLKTFFAIDNAIAGLVMVGSSEEELQFKLAKDVREKLQPYIEAYS